MLTKGFFSLWTKEETNKTNGYEGVCNTLTFLTLVKIMLQRGPLWHISVFRVPFVFRSLSRHLAGHQLRQVHQAAAVAILVVVPHVELHHGAINDWCKVSK